jgi:geranylgeranyl transferase type-1 subunit beta
MSVDEGKCTTGNGEKKAKEWEYRPQVHGRFFKYHIHLLPFDYASLDTNRSVAFYFALSALKLMGQLDGAVPAEHRGKAIDWIYNLQKTDGRASALGFRGSPYMGKLFSPNESKSGARGEGFYDEANLSSTYTCLCGLLLLGDDLNRVNKKAVLGALTHLQRQDGSFVSNVIGGESDLRFLYCAVVICVLLGDSAFASIDVDRAVGYILRCRSYDGAFGLRPHGEGHGGSTFVAIASLDLLGKLDSISSTRAATLKWCMLNQGSGFVGRPNKAADSCYSWWVGATLKVLGGYGMTNVEGNRAFISSCESRQGGFAKYADVSAEILHAYFGTAGLALMGKDGLLELDPRLNLAKECLTGIDVPGSSHTPAKNK